MGDPRRLKKKYSTPQHPWEAKRIEQEYKIRKEYGLKNKKDIWKTSTILRKIKQQTRKLISQENEQARKEEKQLIEKLIGLNLINEGAKIEDVLGIDLKKLLERRLQTQVLKRGLARSTRQARQFITHKHIMIGDEIVNKPSYLVTNKEEAKIGFNSLSVLSKSDHPERDLEGKKKAKSRIVKPLKKPVEKFEKPKKKEIKEKPKKVEEKK